MNEKLPAFVLAKLFSNSLVYMETMPASPQVAKHLPAQQAPAEANKKYLGNYEKKIIILVSDAMHTHLSDEDLAFLSGILNACKLNLAHIALINVHHAETGFMKLKAEMQPQVLIGFGVKALDIQLPFDMPNYQVQQYSNCAIVTAPALYELNNDSPEAKAEKGKLWKSLQKIFNIEK